MPFRRNRYRIFQNINRLKISRHLPIFNKIYSKYKITHKSNCNFIHQKFIHTYLLTEYHNVIKLTSKTISLLGKILIFRFFISVL